MIKKNIRAVLLAVCIAMAAPCTVFAADADQVTDMIELLPSDIKDMTEKMRKKLYTPWKNMRRSRLRKS